MFVTMGLGCWIWGLRLGVLDSEFRVLGLGAVGFGYLVLVLDLFFEFWITGFRFQILTSEYRGTISRVTGGNHLEGHGGTSWSVPGEPAACATPTDIYSEL